MAIPELFPITLEFIGTILIGIAVPRVHTKVSKEHRIDKKVLRSIKRERSWTIVGIMLITVGFLINSSENS